MLSVPEINEDKVKAMTKIYYRLLFYKRINLYLRNALGIYPLLHGSRSIYWGTRRQRTFDPSEMHSGTVLDPLSKISQSIERLL